MGGYIMQLQNFSVNDGEGIRTTVFLAGCPLRCAWCSNPEGQTMQNPMTRWAETEEILQEIRRQAIFYRHSGGGVTFSGGEATAQPQFLKELTDALYDEGFSLALETCGQFDFSLLEPTLRKMDLIFLDLKHIDPEKHRELTGADNQRILENIVKTARLGVPMVVRIPAILGVNCDDAAMLGALSFLRDNHLDVAVEFLPYHRYGEDKYRQLGKKPPDSRFEIPTQEQLQAWEQLAAQMGLRVVSYK